jgi:ATP-dependent DNA helicase RecQ
MRKHEFFFNKMEGALLDAAREKVRQVIDYCDLDTCRKKYLLNYFGENTAKDTCDSCDVCTGEKEAFDATTIAKKIMSAILKTDSRFGKRYIMDILLGKKVKKVLERGHEELSVFGILTECNDNELGRIFDQIVTLGFIAKAEGEYPTFLVTQKGIVFLKDAEAKLDLQRPKAKFPSGGGVPAGRGGYSERDISQPRLPKSKKPSTFSYDENLFEELRILRRQLADEAGLPPFMIFSDVSLREMATHKPRTKDEFASINGVGAKKLAQYADIFTTAITNSSHS